MTDWLSQLSSIWIFILIVLVLIIALVLVVISALVRRSEETETSGTARGAAPAAILPVEGAPEPTGRTESAAGSFSRAMRFLRSTVGARPLAKKTDWFLLITALRRAIGMGTHWWWKLSDSTRSFGLRTEAFLIPKPCT